MLTGRLRGLALVVVVALCAPLTAQKSQLGYYRQPAIWNDTLVFVAEGDLWRVGVGGGVAQRLTTHPEEESRPAISPDGKTVAYAATYEGPGEVYTLPLEGGVPTRQTWDATRPAWLSWTPKGEVLYATRRHSTLPNAQLVRLDPPTHARTTRRPGPGLGRLVRRGGRHAVLHAPRVPGQPHAALQGRHGPEPVALRRRRHGSGRADGRLRGHQQDADAVEGPRLLRVGPRRRDEPVVHERARRRPEAAHEAPRLRGAVAVALERPDRLSAGRRHPGLRHRVGLGQGRPDHASCRTSTSCANAG